MANTYAIQFLPTTVCRVSCTAFPNPADLIMVREMAPILFLHSLYYKALCCCDACTHLSNQVRRTTRQTSSSACCPFILSHLNLSSYNVHELFSVNQTLLCCPLLSPAFNACQDSIIPLPAEETGTHAFIRT